MKTTSSQILKAVCGYYNIKQITLQSENRKSEIVNARHIYSYLAKKYTKEKDLYIGILINRDRTTIIHSYNKISNEIEIYSNLSKEIEEIKEIILDNKLVIKDIDLLALSINYTNSFVL